jgi:hypothetical protein
MPEATLVAFLGSKPEPLERLLGELQAALRQRLGDGFVAYNPGQIHATLIGLERRPGVALDLEALADHVRSRLAAPLRLRFGGFQPGEVPFTSRGHPPFERSFSLQGDKAVLIGWPACGGDYPDWLDALRRELQRYGARHVYHARPEDVDNDAYLRLGFVPADLAADRRAAIEQELRGALAARPPVEVELGVEAMAFAVYAEATLRNAATRVVRLADPGAAARVRQLLAT